MKNANRKSPRSKAWDYSWAACYHVVFCTHGRACLLSRIVADEGGCAAAPTALGRACENAIGTALARFPGTVVHASCVMPNHIHLLVEIPSGEGAVSLNAFVGCLKTNATRRARADGLLAPGEPLWQRSFYDRIVRDVADFEQIADYIRCNPGKWFEDKYYQP